LNALDQAEDGLSTSQLQGKVNIPAGKILTVLKLLSLEEPSPVTKVKNRWYATPIRYQVDRNKIAKLTEIRRQEQARMVDYANTNQCLMTFLAAELDDKTTRNCGRCMVCLGESPISESYSSEKDQAAMEFLRRRNYPIQPRKKWPVNGNINKSHMCEMGYALSRWGDEGWGSLVQQGKYKDEYFSDVLVDAVSQLISSWQPNPSPTWITCVPSLNRPELVSSFARRLAQKLNLPFVDCIRKVRSNSPQKEMQNSAQQFQNLEGIFEVTHWQGIEGPVLLIDDLVDSRWTFTVIAALLRQAGSGMVFPLALAQSSSVGE
jgi:ATP-dependent DNA helicase RecQ